MRQIAAQVAAVIAVAIVGAAAIGWATPAQAAAPGRAHPAALAQTAETQPDITPVSCGSGPPPPISFISQAGGVKCFGGFVGVISTRFFSSGFDAGGYYGNFTFTDSNGGTQQVFFRKGDKFGLNSLLITSVAITPPF